MSPKSGKRSAPYKPGNKRCGTWSKGFGIMRSSRWIRPARSPPGARGRSKCSVIFRKKSSAGTAMRCSSRRMSERGCLNKLSTTRPEPEKSKRAGGGFGETGVVFGRKGACRRCAMRKGNFSASSRCCKTELNNANLKRSCGSGIGSSPPSRREFSSPIRRSRIIPLRSPT